MAFLIPSHWVIVWDIYWQYSQCDMVNVRVGCATDHCVQNWLCKLLTTLTICFSMTWSLPLSIHTVSGPLPFTFSTIQSFSFLVSRMLAMTAWMPYASMEWLACMHQFLAHWLVFTSCPTHHSIDIAWFLISCWQSEAVSVLSRLETVLWLRHQIEGHLQSWDLQVWACPDYIHSFRCAVKNSLSKLMRILSHKQRITLTVKGLHAWAEQKKLSPCIWNINIGC